MNNDLKELINTFLPYYNSLAFNSVVFPYERAKIKTLLVTIGCTNVMTDDDGRLSVTFPADEAEAPVNKLIRNKAVPPTDDDPTPPPMKPFNLEAAKAGKAVVTYTGEDVRNLVFDIKDSENGYDYTMAGIICHSDGRERMTRFLEKYLRMKTERKEGVLYPQIVEQAYKEGLNAGIVHERVANLGPNMTHDQMWGLSEAKSLVDEITNAS